jgi:hypothetical protein
MGTFQDWKRECAEIEREMDRLITDGRPSTVEERQVRQLQYAALLERRDAAALMRSDAAGRPLKGSVTSS